MHYLALALAALARADELLVRSDDDRLARRIHGDKIFDTKSYVDERDRVAEFHRRYGQKWPPPKLTSKELPSYTEAMVHREAEIMLLQDSQARWDAWMFLAQARLMHNFTVPQWEVVQAPPEIYAKLLKNVRDHLANPRREREDDATAHSGVEGPNEPDFIDQERLNYEVLDALKPLHEAWCQCELEPTSVYGVRLYREGATLVDHLDVPETHVISSILHIDSKLDAPYPIEIQDVTGDYAAVDLKPGEMMFYESAKCFHRRSIPMKGDYYGSVFLHYRPKNWTFNRVDIRVAIPPHWGEGLGRRSVAVGEDGTVEDTSIVVEFALGRGAPAGVSVELAWAGPDGLAPVTTLSSESQDARLGTHVGHRFVATPSNGAAAVEFVVGAGTGQLFEVWP